MLVCSNKVLWWFSIRCSEKNKGTLLLTFNENQTQLWKIYTKNRQTAFEKRNRQYLLGRIINRQKTSMIIKFFWRSNKMAPSKVKDWFRFKINFHRGLKKNVYWAKFIIEASLLAQRSHKKYAPRSLFQIIRKMLDDLHKVHTKIWKKAINCSIRIMWISV